MIEVVYLDKDNPNILVFKQNGVLIPFEDVDRIVVTFMGTTEIADSSVNPEFFDWTSPNVGLGEVKFNFNTMNIPAGREYHPSTICIYDPSHLAGQTLIHMKDRKVDWLFCD